MLHVFLVNPVAGTGKRQDVVITEVSEYFRSHGGAFEIRYTSAPLEGEKIARTLVQQGQEIRLYVCGGDGTLQEVANGVLGYPNVEVGLIPCGHHNQIIYGFPQLDFSSVAGQINGSAVEMDLLSVNGRAVCHSCWIGVSASLMESRLSLLHTLSKVHLQSFTLRTSDEQVRQLQQRCLLAANCPNYCSFVSGPEQANAFDGHWDLFGLSGYSRLHMLSSASKGKVAFQNLGQYLDAELQSQRPVPMLLDGEVTFAQTVQLQTIPKGLRLILPSVQTEGKQSKLSRECHGFLRQSTPACTCFSQPDVNKF